MPLVCILIVALLCWPSIHLLVRAMHSQPKPKKTEVAGVLLVTAVMAAYLGWLMFREHLF